MAGIHGAILVSLPAARLMTANTKLAATGKHPAAAPVRDEDLGVRGPVSGVVHDSRCDRRRRQAGDIR